MTYMTDILLHECDYQDLAGMIAPDGIDLIYTDPPYARKQAVPCYQMLAEYSPEHLRRGGSLITITPHYLLPEVFEIMKDSLKFRWQYIMDQSAGSHPRMAMGIEVMYKPVLHFVKQAYPMGRGFVKDMVTIPEPHMPAVQ